AAPPSTAMAIMAHLLTSYSGYRPAVWRPFRGSRLEVIVQSAEPNGPVRVPPPASADGRSVRRDGRLGSCPHVLGQRAPRVVRAVSGRPRTGGTPGPSSRCRRGR